VPFDRAIAPALGDGAFDGAQVLSQLPDEALQGVDLRGGRSRHPLVQGRDLPDTQDRAEAQHQAAHRREPRTVVLQGVHGLGLAFVEARARLTEQRGGDLWRHVASDDADGRRVNDAARPRWGGRIIPPSRDELGQAGVAADIAERLDLGDQPLDTLTPPSSASIPKML
jgi:hypothetical protein